MQSNTNDDDDDDDDDGEEEQTKITVIARNFQGYDSYFLLQEYQLQARDYNQIRNGGKVLELRVEKPGKGKLRFIDSLSFLPMPLASFTSTFGFDENDATLNLKNRYFPHFFNVPENQDYCGPLPDKRFYGPDTMSQNRFRAFEQWYDQTNRQPDYRFDFRAELEAYCASDVRLFVPGVKRSVKSSVTWPPSIPLSTSPLRLFVPGTSENPVCNETPSHLNPSTVGA